MINQLFEENFVKEAITEFVRKVYLLLEVIDNFNSEPHLSRLSLLGSRWKNLSRKRRKKTIGRSVTGCLQAKNP